MRVLHLVSSLGIGGAEKFVYELSIEQKKQGHQVYVLALESKNNTKDEHYQNQLLRKLRENNIEVEFANHVRKYNVLALRKILIEFLKKYKCEVVHSHLLTWSVPLHFCNQEFINIYTQHTFRLRFPRLHKYFLSRNIHSYIGICDSSMTSLSRHIGEDKAFKITNGINTEKFYSIKNARNQPLKIIMISRLDENKNHILALKAIAKLRTKNQLTLTVVGSGPEETNLKKYCEINDLTGIVNFTGVRSDIPELLNTHDLFLLISHREGYSLSLCEAFCSNIEIIASRVGGNAEILGNGKFGTLISEDNQKELESAITQVIEGAVSSIDRDSAIKKMDISFCAEQHIKHYSNLRNRESS